MLPLIKEIAEASKRQILLELRSGPKSVNELVEITCMKQPNVSNHLAKLRSKGMVKAAKVGRQVYYSIASPEIEELLREFADKPKAESSIKSADLEDLAKAFARSAVAGDEQSCAKIIDQLIRQNVPLVRIYQQVLAESMNFVGRWYEVEAVDVGQEHLASAITERMMARVMHFAQPNRPPVGTALIGCVSGNWHALGARMISDFMRLAGWKSVFMGASTPSESFLSGVKEHEPHIVLLSVAFDDHREHAVELIRQLNQVRKSGLSFWIGVGGRQASYTPEAFVEAGADFTSANLMVFSEEILPRLNESPSQRLGIFGNHKKVD